MNSTQMSGHIVFAVEFLVTNGTGVTFAVQMCGYIMSMEIGGMCVRVITNFATVRIALL